MDVDSIAPGLDFVRVMEEQVENCDVLLAIIGKHWIDAQRRTWHPALDDPNDFVRIEIEAALNQDKRVIPVLVGETQHAAPGGTAGPNQTTRLAPRRPIDPRAVFRRCAGPHQGSPRRVREGQGSAPQAVGASAIHVADRGRSDGRCRSRRPCMDSKGTTRFGACSKPTFLTLLLHNATFMRGPKAAWNRA